MNNVPTLFTADTVIHLQEHVVPHLKDQNCVCLDFGGKESSSTFNIYHQQNFPYVSLIFHYSFVRVETVYDTKLQKKCRQISVPECKLETVQTIKKVPEKVCTTTTEQQCQIVTDVINGKKKF